MSEIDHAALLYATGRLLLEMSEMVLCITLCIIIQIIQIGKYFEFKLKQISELECKLETL